MKAILQIAESNLKALRTVQLGPKRPFSVGECELRARLTGPRFAAQAAAAVSLVEAPANHCKATTVVKKVMAIMPGNWTSFLIEKFLEAPFAGKLETRPIKSTEILHYGLKMALKKWKFGDYALIHVLPGPNKSFLCKLSS